MRPLVALVVLAAPALLEAQAELLPIRETPGDASDIDFAPAPEESPEIVSER